MNPWVTADAVRDYVNYKGSANGRYSDGAIGSNIRAAQLFFEREASRQLEVVTESRTFTTHGAPQIAIPDLSSVVSVTMQGTTLVEGTTYWLVPDVRHSGVSVAVQLRPFGRGGSYRSNPEWFDRNLDSRLWQAGGSLPGDLVIDGTWGWADKPDDVLVAVKAYAAWLLKRADAGLANAVADPMGNVSDYSQVPVEMASAIRAYRRGEQAAIVG